MIRMLAIVLGVLVSVNSNAADKLFSKTVGVQSYSFEKIRAFGPTSGYTKIQTPEFQLSSTVGAPALPVKSWLVKGRPEQIQVKMNVSEQKVLADTRPFPVQKQPCRCVTDEIQTFSMDQKAYSQSEAPYTVSYLGAFRGQPISVINVSLASYNAQENTTTLKTAVNVEANVEEFAFAPGVYKDYLILVPAKLADGVKEFADWKRSRGYNVTVQVLQANELTLANVGAQIKTGYAKSGVDYVMLIGDEKTIPMFSVKTSGSSTTPSDLQYFTMDGAADHVPDMFSGRILGTTVKAVSDRLAKAIEFEKKVDAHSTGLSKIIGIASNEGSSPSDNEYVTSIEDRFKKTLNYGVTHFFQNESSSKPTELNKAFDLGAGWLVYLGHGSGTSWPSMFNQYTVADTTRINNLAAAKPIIIDVACMNGKLVDGYLGTTFSSVQTAKDYNPFGMAAYFGGSVNISWHPPAVMARGIAFEHLQKNFKTLGEALLAGQLYLAANWTNTEEVIDNAEWYHLQGDPGMAIGF